jgi:signal transduction histidine kinase
VLPTAPTSRAARRWVGVAVVVLVVLLQTAAELLAGHAKQRVMLRLGFTAVEMVVLMLALSASVEWATRRRLGSVLQLVAGMVLAGALGAMFGVVLWKIGVLFPEFRSRPGPVPPPWRSAVFGFMFGQFHFGIWALAFVYPFAVEDARVRALEAERLASAADLARLRAHLEPHFLLNTLNAIAGLVTEEPREARRLIAALGDLLSDATEDGDEMRPLADEIGWLRRYAAIFEARYGGAVRFAWEIDPRARDVRVPRLLLQPLVENAVKHGALVKEDVGTVTVRVEIAGELLRCTIADDGPGMSPGPARDGAFGLDSVRRRISLKEPRASIAMESSSEGTRAIVCWPIDGHVADSSPAPEELPEAAE